MPEYTTYSGGLGGWPLPTMADGDALHVTRTKAFSAVEGQKTLRTRRGSRVFSVLFLTHFSPSGLLSLQAQKAGSPKPDFQPL
jgi:hypothetical protein